MATYPRSPVFQPSRKVPTDSSLNSWTNANPNLYTNPVPKNQFDWTLPKLSQVAPYSAAGRDWTSGNPSLFTNPVPKNQYDWPLPKTTQAAPVASGANDWVSGNAVFLPTPPPAPTIYPRAPLFDRTRDI